ncbi:hypothetical protein L1987_74918 [Smallanthus sonchifolius]|uniref:Uncharacterized protein n=1 Tax=Smallanthus sonchifolius TaxID=185202 RepID=A0ACB9A3W9_9ASTR|nr:hypothetical protein L1987_74918 [Smallanthus sonchifolius]
MVTTRIFHLLILFKTIAREFHQVLAIPSPGKVTVKKIVIEMRPNYHPEGLYDDNKVSTESKEIDNIIKQLWHVNGMCPEDNPIQKNKRRCFESKFC